MRPALEALAAQQKQITEQSDTITTQNQRIAALGHSVEVLTKGLQALASMAGVQNEVVAAMIKRADVQNPAQPVPEPPAVPPTQTTQDAKTPEAFADVNAPGLVPGSTQDVAADAVSTVYTPGMDVDAPALKNLVDVTAPVDGTQNPRPLNEVKTLTDVRAGDPMKPDVAFPLRGDFANAQRTASVQNGQINRTLASIKLARLRIQAGLAPEGLTDLEVAPGIERDASLSDSDIMSQISLMEGIRTAASRKTSQPASQRLVPRTASTVRRTVPSMQNGATPLPARTAAVEDEDVSDLFD
jgi:uncharacterized coiled-coil protein SlyX